MFENCDSPFDVGVSIEFCARVLHERLEIGLLQLFTLEAFQSRVVVLAVICTVRLIPDR